jgi:hypothetical protein
MALQTQGSDVLEVAFPSALYHGNNVISVPERLSRTHAPLDRSFQPCRASQTLQVPFCMQTIDTASGAHTAIAFQNFFTNIAWVAAQAPFFDAPRRTKCLPALGNLQIAPTAQAAAIGTLGERLPIGPTAGHLPICSHEMLVTSKNSKKGTGSRWGASKS